MDLKMLSTIQIAGFSNLEQKQWNSVIFYVLMQSDESLSLFKIFCLNLVKMGVAIIASGPFFAGIQLSVPNLVQLSVPDFQKGGSGKKWVPVGIYRVSAMDIFLVGDLLCFLSEKTFKKYGFEGSISNVDLGLF